MTIDPTQIDFADDAASGAVACEPRPPGADGDARLRARGAGGRSLPCEHGTQRGRCQASRQGLRPVPRNRIVLSAFSARHPNPVPPNRRGCQRITFKPPYPSRWRLPFSRRHLMMPPGGLLLASDHKTLARPSKRRPPAAATGL